ncbi:MAG: helicase-related protein [Syntrophobacteraceae bacterium]
MASGKIPSKFLKKLGFAREIYTVIGKGIKDKYGKTKIPENVAKNRYLEVDDCIGKDGFYFCPNGYQKDAIRSKRNVHHFFTLWGDVDYKDGELARSKAPEIHAKLKALRLYHIIVCSGNGLQIYIPAKITSGANWEKYNNFLNKIIFKGYPADPHLFTNFSSFLRLPETFNEKNPEHKPKCEILIEWIPEGVDYHLHNIQTLTRLCIEWSQEATPEERLELENPFIRSLDMGFIKSELLDAMLACDLQLIFEMNWTRSEGRRLNKCLLPNLMHYAKFRNRAEHACRFLEAINADVGSAKRWLKVEKRVDVRIKQLFDWAGQYFPGTLAHELAKKDYFKARYHFGYHTLFQNQNFESVDEMRAAMKQTIDECLKKGKGLSYLFGETGLGKTKFFEKLKRENNLNVVFMVPFTSLRNEIQLDTVYTFDTVRPTHPRNIELMKHFRNGGIDIFVIDEAHCLETHENMKKDVTDVVGKLATMCSRKMPVFMLSATPAVNQIPIVEEQGFKFLLNRSKKKIELRLVDDKSLVEHIRNFNRVLLFTDDKKDIGSYTLFLDQFPELKDHRIIPITSLTKPKEKGQIQNNLKSLEKFIIVSTSAFSSGINVDLDTVVLTPKVTTQEDIFQVVGRIRILNKLDQIHPIYILVQSGYLNPNRSMDSFEYVTYPTLIVYLSSLYYITGIKDYWSDPIPSPASLTTIDSYVHGIMRTENIADFYERYLFRHWKIPVEALELADRNGKNLDHWLGHPYSWVTDKRNDKNGESDTSFVKVRMDIKLRDKKAKIQGYGNIVAACNFINDSINRERALHQTPAPIRNGIEADKLFITKPLSSSKNS